MTAVGIRTAYLVNNEPVRLIPPGWWFYVDRRRAFDELYLSERFALLADLEGDTEFADMLRKHQGTVVVDQEDLENWITSMKPKLH